MHRDARLLLAARVVRNFAYGYLVVVLGIYLDLLGLTPFEIGAVLTASLLGSAALTVGWSLVADRVGRRRSLVGLAALMVLGGAAFALSRDPWVLAIASFAGSLSSAGTDTGTFVTVDQAMLPQITPDHRRTSTFAVQNTFATLAVAGGSLAASAVALFTGLGLHGADAYRPFFVLFALVGLFDLVLFARLSPAVEADATPSPVSSQRSWHGLGASSGLIGILVMLNVIDSLAGGLMLQSLVAYWFYVVWGVNTATLAGLFFAMNVLSGLSMLSAGRIAERIGLRNLMILSHLPQGIFGLLMPFAPTAWLAMGFWLIRNTIGYIFFPVRLSYVMGIVPPDERSAAAGYTTAARNIAGTLTPAVAGAAFSVGLFGAPFIASGILKLAFDGLAILTLRDRRPPEEMTVEVEPGISEGPG
jgi:MFS family permease